MSDFGLWVRLYIVVWYIYYMCTDHGHGPVYVASTLLQVQAASGIFKFKLLALRFQPHTIHIIKDQKLTFNILYSSIPLIASVSRHFATIKNGSLAAFSARTASIWQILFAHSLEDGLGHLPAPCLRKFQFQFRASQALGTWPLFPGKCEPWVGGSLDELHFSSGPRDRKCYSKLWQLSAAPRKWKWIYGKLTLDSRRNIWYGMVWYMVEQQEPASGTWLHKSWGKQLIKLMTRWEFHSRQVRKMICEKPEFSRFIN